MGEVSQTKLRLDEFRNSLPIGDEHVEPTREMLRVTSYACNGAENKMQAIADAVGSVALYLAMVHRGEATRITDIVTQAVKEHAVVCKGTAQPDATPTTKLGVFLLICRTLTPWRWPAALAACSPFTSDLVVKVVHLLKEVSQ